MAQFTGTQKKDPQAEKAERMNKVETVATPELREALGAEGFAVVCAYFHAYRDLGYANLAKPLANEGQAAAKS